MTWDKAASYAHFFIYPEIWQVSPHGQDWAFEALSPNSGVGSQMVADSSSHQGYATSGLGTKCNTVSGYPAFRSLPILHVFLHTISLISPAPHGPHVLLPDWIGSLNLIMFIGWRGVGVNVKTSRHACYAPRCSRPVPSLDSTLLFFCPAKQQLCKVGQ